MPGTAIAYARYSDDQQREESLTAQFRAIQEYAQKHKISILREYADEAKSATTDDRPGFLRMIADLKTKQVKADLVLVHKLDRFARNRYDSAVYRKELARVGARLVAVDQPLDDSPESGLLEGMLESLAEYYSKNLAREVMKGLKENAYQARFNGGWVPLGYAVIDGRYQINEREALVVRLIFSLYLDGHGYGLILQKLNSLGYKTKRGWPFGKNSIYEILRNPKYAGHYVFNKAPRRIDGKRNWHRKKKSEEIITVKDALPAIISEDDFRRVQEMMKAKEKGPRQQKDSTVYILTGKAVCGECGGALVGNSSRRAAGAEPTRYYECSRKLRTKECGLRRIPKDELEGVAFEVIQKNILSPEKLPEVANKLVAMAREKNQESEREENALKMEMADVNDKITNIVSAVEGGADFQIFGDRLKELKARREEIQSRLGALKSPLEGITEEMVLGYLSAIPKPSVGHLTDLEKKKIVDAYVHEITVYQNRTNVDLKVVIGADKDGVGGLTLPYPHTAFA